MRDLNLIRSDFKCSQDVPYDSFFDWVLRQLGIPEDRWDDIDEVTINDIMVDSIKY